MKHSKPTVPPSTESNRLTPEEIDELRESVHRRDAEMRAILAARKKQAVRQYAPWSTDPDPPQKPMTEEEMKSAAQAIKKRMCKGK
jgi:hypothetical protein